MRTLPSTAADLLQAGRASTCSGKKPLLDEPVRVAACVGAEHTTGDMCNYSMLFMLQNKAVTLRIP